jgi:hypothetical protein
MFNIFNRTLEHLGSLTCISSPYTPYIGDTEYLHVHYKYKEFRGETFKHLNIYIKRGDENEINKLFTFSDLGPFPFSTQYSDS